MKDNNFKKILLIISMLLFLTAVGNTQTLDTVAKLKTHYQLCLDSGVNFQNCARTYCMSLYKMVDTAYENLNDALSPNERLILKNDQAQWLKKRSKFEKEQSKEFQENIRSGTWGYEMAGEFFYEHDAEFTRKRIVELIKKREKKAACK